MNWGWFDNKYKKAQEENTSPVDLEGLWASLEPEVDAINEERKKKRRAAFWLFFFGTAVLIGGIYFGFCSNSETNSQAELSSNKKIENIEISSQEINTEKLNAVKRTNSNSDKKEINLANKKNNKTFSDHKKEKIKSSLKSSKDNTSSQTKKKPISIGAPNKTTERITKQKNTNTNHPIKSKFDKVRINRINTKKESKINWQLPELIKIEKLSNPIVDKNIKSFEDSEKNSDEGQADTTPNKSIKYNLLISGGINYSRPEFGANENGNAFIQQLNDKSTSTLEAINFGIGFNARHKTGIGIRTGLEYLRLNEKVEFNSNSINNDSIFGVQYFVVNLNSDTIPVMGNVPNEISTSVEKRFFNNYTFWNIPLVVSYLQVGEKWAWGAEVGLIANIRMETEGRYLLSETEDAELENISQTNIGLSYQLGLMIQRQLNDNVALTLAPKATYFSKDFTKNAVSPFSKKYSLYGVDLRLSYFF